MALAALFCSLINVQFQNNEKLNIADVIPKTESLLCSEICFDEIFSTYNYTVVCLVQ